MRKTITKDQLLALQQSHTSIKLVDIRSPQKYEKLHIPCVVNIPSERLADELTTLSKEETIVCICNHGKERSQQAAELLYNTGFEKTFYLEGGTAGWYN